MKITQPWSYRVVIQFTFDGMSGVSVFSDDEIDLPWDGLSKDGLGMSEAGPRNFLEALRPRLK